ncbi:MAG: HAMP domain-containing histidine kinase [Treponema sp.]|nr:HAMP domain-containing histidine kinase [Treponema sp.]
MTIRKQVSILILLIVLIPLFCAIVIPGYQYFTSSSRLILNAHIKSKSLENTSISKSQWKELKKSLKLLPSDVEIIIVSRNNQIVYSNMPEVAEDSVFDRTFFWFLVNSTSKEYHYQFSTTSEANPEFFLITRIAREKRDRRKPSYLLPIILVGLIFIVAAMIITVSMLARNIFMSITMIERQTKGIAEGNLNIKVDPLSNKSRYRHRKTVNNEITSLADSLNKMRETLIEEQNRRLKFVMGISHDLRTPVAVIKGYNEALADGIISPGAEMDEAIALIGTKISQLEDMINTLINFMKLDVADWRHELVDQDVTELLVDFGKSAEITGTVFKRNITSYFDFSGTIKVPLDKQLVNRALENLLSNAIRYTKDGDSINLKGINLGDKIIFTISDTGCGIEEKDLDHIFDLFYRGTGSRREEGMGIGLSVVKTIMDTHGWNIYVKSKPGEGTTFSIEIPYNC